MGVCVGLIKFVVFFNEFFMGFIFFFVIYVEVFVFYFNDVGFFVGVDYYVWKGVVYYEECVKFSFDFVCVFYDVG